MGVRNRGTKAGLILSGTECSHLNSRLPSIPLPERKCTIFLRGGGGWAGSLDGSMRGPLLMACIYRDFRERPRAKVSKPALGRQWEVKYDRTTSDLNPQPLSPPSPGTVMAAWAWGSGQTLFMNVRRITFDIK